MSEILRDDFEYLVRVLKECSGIALSEDKQYLVESRLLPVVRKHGLGNIHNLVEEMQQQEKSARGMDANPLLSDVVEAMTTNETSFFRDTKPFDQFRKIILPLLFGQSREGPLRFWSAAGSTGQEAYTVAMCLTEEKDKLAGRPLDILATDIAHRVLEKAREGEYTQFEVQRGMPITMLVKYFEQEKDVWRVKESIRAMVRFERQNLLEDFSALGPFDVVFCRNVLIYFEVKTKKDILKRMARALKPGGFLFLGSSESIFDLSKDFKPVEGTTSVYQLK